MILIDTKIVVLNLYNEIQAARNVPDWQVLASLNIKGIGPNIAKSILREYTLGELEGLSAAELAKIDGIGPERATALEEELKAQKAFLDELLGCVSVRVTKNTLDTPRPTICFTGKMPEKRSYYESLAAENGYEAVDSVTASLSLLVAADGESDSTKARKAAKLGVKVLALTQWLATLSGEKKETPPEDDLFAGQKF